MGAIVDFDYATFKARFPEFETLPEEVVLANWEEACIKHNNTGGSSVQTEGSQRLLLNLLTAHFVAIEYPNGATRADPNAPTGPVSGAGQGSVNVQFAQSASSGDDVVFFKQTRYGYRYYMLMKQYAKFRYVQGPSYQPYPDSIFPYRRYPTSS